jgi:uncharacterized protein
VWIALAIENYERHEAAMMGWLESVVEPAWIVFCRATQQSFLRLITTSAI